MIDERILQELDVIGAVEADVRFSPGTRKGILELVAFYRRMHDRRLGDLYDAEQALRQIRDPLAWVCDHEVLQSFGDDMEGAIARAVDTIDRIVDRRETINPTPKRVSDERIAAFRHSAECRRAFFAGETAGCSCGSDGDADAD